MTTNSKNLPTAKTRNTDTQSFLGTGWNFPVKLDTRGIETVAGDDSIHQAVLLIIFTRPGERLMLPDFGCRIYELLFAPLNTTTQTLAALYVTEALNTWEPRITGVKVQTSAGSSGELIVEVDYHVIATNSRRNMVFPFYLSGIPEGKAK